MTIPDYRRTPYALQLLYLILIAIGCAIIGLVVSLGVVALFYGRDMVWHIIAMNDTGTPGFIGAFRIFMGLGNTLFTFFVSALMFAYFVAGEPDGYLKARNYFPPVLLFIVLAFMLFFLPVIDITAYFNEKMTLPPGLHGLDKWIHDTEKQNEAVVKVALNMRNIGDLLWGVFIVALLPALSEEFFFRGCMQTIFVRWIKNKHIAVWVTAVVFSFFHFEFLGFVPRMLLGAALGYFFIWTGSIWPSVWAHFLNNGVSVVGYYMYQHHQITADPDSNTPMFTHMYIYFLSLVISVMLMLFYRKITIDKQLVTDGEELD